MAIESWESTKQWNSTFASGDQFEADTRRVISRYTPDIWHNVRVETLLSTRGNTEIDLVFCYCNIVFIVELKRVRRIEGKYSDFRWTMWGWKSQDSESNKYIIPNVIGQNNIHVRSFLDYYFASLRAYPTVVPLIIVPNNCVFDDSLRSDVFTVHDLDAYLTKCKGGANNRNLVVRLSYLLGGDAPIKQREDFIEKENGRRGRPTRIR